MNDLLIILAPVNLNLVTTQVQGSTVPGSGLRNIENKIFLTVM